MTHVFFSTTDGTLSFDEVTTLLTSFLEDDPDAEYTLVIGSDSHEKKEIKTQKRVTTPITALVIHRKGFGGKYFWFKNSVAEIHTLREKIYAETIASLTFATEFVPHFKKHLNGNSPKYHLEIHVDVGEHGATRDMIKEVVGMVTGSGFVAKTKPNAFGASSIADKHT